MTTTFPQVFLSTATTAVRVSRAAGRRHVRKIGPRLYTTRVKDTPADVIRDNRWQIVALYAPRATIGFRTALEGRPTADGAVFVSGTAARRIDLPGLKIRVVPGPGPLEGDVEFIGGLHYASRARAILEALKPSRSRQTAARGLARAQIEALLDRELELGDEEKLNAIRDQARRLAPALGAARECQLLDRIVGALLATHDEPVSSPTARGRLSSPPYDGKRLVLFEALRATLVNAPVASRPDPAATGAAFRNLAFLDAYFSNFIEGTEFEIDEARDIVFHRRVLPTRPADSHDVLGTFQLVGQRDFLRTGIRDLRDGEAFLTRLAGSHAAIMAGRPEQQPGHFKTRPNRAGTTVFVQPEAVRDTLLQGFVIARALENAFARAAAIMFVVSEVHPFADGNGRVARALMNAELFAAGECRILIPNVFRDDYVTALRALTRHSHAEPFLRVLDFAQRVTASLDYTNLDRAIAALTAANAFADPKDGARLRLPALAADPEASAREASAQANPRQTRPRTGLSARTRVRKRGRER
jgi:hypothetical protein